MKWGGVICFIGLFAFIIYRYNSQLWILAVRLWDIFEDHHRLKEFIFSFGIYSPLAFILLPVIQTDAFRNFSGHFHDWKDTRDIDGNPSGSEGF